MNCKLFYLSKIISVIDKVLKLVYMYIIAITYISITLLPFLLLLLFDTPGDKKS